MKEYDSIPPLIYQLCGLTKLTQSQSSALQKGGFGRKDSILSYKILHGIAHFLTLLDDEGKGQEEVRWTISTSLSHLGRILRNNPSLPTVMLNLIKGKQQHQVPRGQGIVEPLRFKRMTPMLLAMGLTMASSIPRMKTNMLEAVRELVVEEEIVRWKRCSSKWVNSAVALLSCSGKAVDEEGNGEEDGDSLLEELRKYGHNGEIESGYHLNDQSHMMQCMKSLIMIADGNSGNDGFTGIGRDSLDAEFSSLYPTLVSLGFMLVDSVKKDLAQASSNSVGAYTLPPIPSCASEVTNNSMHTIQQKAHFSTAKIGRSLLVHLFLQAGGNTGDDGVVTDSGFSGMATASPLCRTIFVTACEKFCGMAPNAIEHSYLFQDLVFHGCQDNSGGTNTYGLGARILQEGFVPMIIDLLANIPGGGMPPLVATKSIIPVLSKLLKLSAKKGRQNRRKRNELNDHIDHCFLLAKKALFCTDVDRRKVAVNLLIMLIGVAAESPDDSSALLEEAMGYLKRCMTQHQYEVRLEVYSSLVALIPDSKDENTSATNLPTSSQTQGEKKNDCKIATFVSQIFLNHLERYITVEEDEAVVEARRMRAIAHGTHLSQQVDLESNQTDGAEKDSPPPLRLEMCIASARSSAVSNGQQLGSNKRSKKKAKSPDILSEAKNRISEPLSFLLAASIAATNDNSNTPSSGSSISGLYDALIRLRNKMSDCENVDQFMKWCEKTGDNKAFSHEYYVKVLSTCLLVASVSDTLMGIPAHSGNLDLEIFGKLFRLRTDAVYKAAAILAGAKTKNVKKKKKKSSSEADVGDNDDSKQDSMTLVDSRNEANRKVLQKFKFSVEKAIECPASPSEFLAACLRECGILSQPSDTDDVLHSTQSEEDPSKKSGLTSNVDFRRFLLEKCKLLLSGAALLMRTGHRFDIKCDSNMSGGQDSMKEYIGPSFVLGPILFTEFVSLAQNRYNTSLVDHSDTPLADLALEGFIMCAQRILSHVGGLQMDPKQRITGLLMTSSNTVFKQFTSFRDIWNSRAIPASLLQDIPETEKALLKSLFPFVMPMIALNGDRSRARGGLLAELVLQGLDAEAMLFSQLLKCISLQMSPGCREIISLNMLECFRIPDKTEVHEGLIGLDHHHDDDCQKCASTVVDAAILLDGLIEGTVQDPNIPRVLEKNWRTECGFTTITPNEVKRIVQRELMSKDGDALLGNVHLLASSFNSSIGTTCNFDDIANDSISHLEFSCTRIVSSVSASSETVSKELSVASASLLAAIENGLADAEFLSFKIMPHVTNVETLLIQHILTKLLFAIGKVICATAPNAELFDDNGSFASILLKSCKRLYAVYSKVIGYISNYPKAATTPENKTFLQLLSGNLNAKTMALLSTLQEKKIDGTKVLADSKISLQGRIAGQVVFEIERCDNELLKFSTKLKSKGYEDASSFLESKVSANTVRDFRIKRGEIQAARDRAVNSVKKKRKIKSETKKKKKRSKRKEIDNTEDEQDVQNQSSTIDDNSIVGTEEEGQSDDNESCLEDDLVGNFIVNSASESSSEDETEDEM